MPIASPAPTARSRTRLGPAIPRAGTRDAAPSVAGDRTGVTEGTLAGPLNEEGGRLGRWSRRRLAETKSALVSRSGRLRWVD